MEYKHIKITHFVDPYTFWFRISEYDTSFKEFDGELQKYFENVVTEKPIILIKNEMVVGYFMLKWKKWVRGVVKVESHINEDVHETDILNLWLVDFGYFIVAEKKYIKQLPQEFQFWINQNIILGGISSINPAFPIFDSNIGSIQMEKTNHWSLDSILMVKKYIENSSSIDFICEINNNHHYFGKLLIQTKNDECLDMAHVLLKYCHCASISLNDFVSNFTKTHDLSNSLSNQNPNSFSSSEVKNSNETCMLKHLLKLDQIDANDLNQSADVKKQERNLDSGNVISSSMLLPNDTSNNQKNGSESVLNISKGAESTHSNLSSNDINIETIVEDTTNLTESQNSENNLNNSKNASVVSSGNSTSIYRSSGSTSAASSAESSIKSLSSGVTPLQQDHTNRLGSLSNVNASSATENEDLDIKTTEEKNKNQHLILGTTIEPKRDEPEYMTFFERERSHRVLCHGKKKTKAIETLEEANFVRDVHFGLEVNGYRKLFRIQAFCWPHLLRGNSIVIVGSRKTGKTLSYLPVLLSLLISDQDSYTPGTGPVAIVLTATEKHSSKIFEICLNFQSVFAKKLKIIQGHTCSDSKLEAFFYNGIDILLITPKQLESFLFSRSLMNKNRLKHFVIDDFHSMMDNLDSVKNVIKQCCFNNPETQTYDQQLIITSLYWHCSFLKMIKTSNNAIVCIGSYIEAASYAKQDLRILLTSQENKMHKLAEILINSNYLLEHTIVICKYDDEVNQICEYLKSLNIICVECLSSTSMVNRKFVNDWNNRYGCTLEVLVCTDEILPELHVDNVKLLINFSLPETWSIFKKRYSTFFNALPNIVKNETGETNSVILLDESNNDQLPRLIEFLKIHGAKRINSDIENLAMAIRHNQEISKNEKDIDFCKYVLNYGLCTKTNVCKYRHMLTDKDKSILWHPIKKYIKIKIYEVSNPSSFAVEVLATRQSKTDPWIEFNRSDYKAFQTRFKTFYAIKTNHIPYHPAKVGDLCVGNRHEKFFRCKILHIAEKKSVLSDPKCVLKAIDEGITITTTLSRLHYLPDHFKTLPPKLLDITLGGIVSLGVDWPDKSKDHIAQLFKKYEKQNMSVEASCSFVIKDKVYVNEINIMEDLLPYGSELIKMNIKKFIIKMKIGKLDDENFTRTKALVRNAGLYLLDDNIENKILNQSETQYDEQPTNQLLTAQFSYNEDNVVLDKSDNYNEPLSINSNLNSYNDNQRINTLAGDETNLQNSIENVHLSFFHSPLKLYLQKLSSVELIANRLKEIQSHISKKKERLKNITRGSYCIVLFEDLFDRGRVIEVLNDEAVVFLCDVGFLVRYPKDEIYCIPEHLVQLQHEAIECRIYGIKSKSDLPWPEDINDKMFHSIINNFNSFYVYFINFGENSAYNIPTNDIIFIGYDQTLNKGFIINQLIVENDLAEYIPETKSIFEGICRDVLAMFQSEYICNDEQDSTCNNLLSLLDDDNEFDIDITAEEMDQCFNCNITAQIKKFQGTTDDESKKVILDKPVNQSYNERNHTTTYHRKQIGYSNDLQDYSNTAEMHPPLLTSNYSYTSLFTTWNQTASTINLQVDITDFQEYCLTVHKRFIHLHAEFSNNVDKEICLNLFGVINPKYTKAYINGNHLKIVLNKAIQMNIFWPSLLLNNTKVAWLKYDFDSIDNGCDTDLEDYYKYKMVKNIDDSSSNSVSDTDEDECDPFSHAYEFEEIQYSSHSF